METIFGGLIEFDSQKELNEYMENLDVLSATQIIEKQIEYVASHGGFTIVESHVLYKCLTKLKKDADKNQGNHLHNDDTNGDIG
jgi:hypothetical protein